MRGHAGISGDDKEAATAGVQPYDRAQVTDIHAYFTAPYTRSGKASGHDNNLRDAESAVQVW